MFEYFEFFVKNCSVVVLLDYVVLFSSWAEYFLFESRGLLKKTAYFIFDKLMC